MTRNKFNLEKVRLSKTGNGLAFRFPARFYDDVDAEHDVFDVSITRLTTQSKLPTELTEDELAELEVL